MVKFSGIFSRSVRSASDTSPDVIYSGKNSATFHPGSETQFFISMRASNILGQSAAGELNVTLSHIGIMFITHSSFGGSTAMM